MQKPQDMAKAHWLSKPTLGEGLSLSTPGTTGPQKPGSSACTLALQEIALAQRRRGGGGPEYL